MRIVVALGGNALLRRGERPDAGPQLAHIEAAVAALAPLAREHQLLICHGNGPQVGLLALESGADRSLSRAYPLDALVAQTQGMIGYWLTQALTNAGVEPVAALVTQVLVDADDPAFAAPTKFIGPVYEQARAAQLADEHGWTVAPDGPHWRRVVPSPLPVRILEQRTIEQLLQAGSTVVCGGGGGAAVSLDGAGHLRGVEAVVDKDLTAALLAIAVHADHLLVLTDVPAVMEHFGTPSARPLRTLTLEQIAEQDFPAGSMGPKVAACAQFVRATGRPATIGGLAEASALLDGGAGTTVEPLLDHDRQTTSDRHTRIVDAARHAPSVHNTQPWRFTSTADGLQLWADRTRGLPVLDPDGRQLHLSCGAALLHARVAARALGLDVDVRLLPDADEPDLLAELRLTTGADADAEELALAAAIPRRHTSREAFAATALPDKLVDAFRLAAEREGARLRPVVTRADLGELEVLLARADRSQEADPAYRQELAAWVGGASRTDGIPAAALPADPERGSDLRLRNFQPGVPVAPDREPPVAEHPAVVVLGTGDDSPESWLRAGQALGAVLLAAAAAGVVAQPLGQATDSTGVRHRLGSVLGMLGVPQLVLRLGYPVPSSSAGAPVVHTPRRGLPDVLRVAEHSTPSTATVALGALHALDGPPRDVVVGVWDSPDADATVRWAAAQAAARGGRLVLVTVGGWPGDTPPSASARAGTARTLSRLAQAAEAAHPELAPVAVETLHGLPGPSLVARSAAAELLVLGSGSCGPRGHDSSGSVATYCTTFAICPTAVVPGRTAGRP